MDSPSFNTGMQVVIEMYVLQEMTVESMQSCLDKNIKMDALAAEATPDSSNLFAGMQYAIDYIATNYETNFKEALNA